MRIQSVPNRFAPWGALAASLLGGAGSSLAQEALNWEASAHFQYRIHGAAVARNAAGLNEVTVLFSVIDPSNGNQPWDLETAPEFLQPAGVSRLVVAIGWDTSDYQNTGGAGAALTPVPFRTVGGIPSGGGAGVAPALPISVNAVTASKPVDPVSHPGWYFVTAVLPGQAARTAVAALEGHPAWRVTAADGTTTWERVPVKSAYQYFPVTDAQASPRREIVDIAKCQRCHDDRVHDGTTIPRLSLHGGNRTEELRVCVICHNPNQTDIAYRTSGDEVPVDFKTMIHAIHAAEKRHDPLVIVGFRGAINDFSHVKFPGDERNCLHCHVEINGKGTFELPLAASVLGTTLHSGSVPGEFVDVDPANDLKMSPTVAVCSACHDEDEALAHMGSRRTGGSFAALQSDLSSGRVRERCVDCHGPGKERDVRKEHGLKGTSTRSSRRRSDD